MKRGSGYGPRNPRLMIIGEAYGEQERMKNRPFVGAAGQALRGWMMEIGLDPDEVYFDNLINAQPPKNRISAWCPKGKPNNQLAEAMLELMERIATLRPNLILALGNYPMHFLTGKGSYNPKYHSITGIGDWRGSILESNIIPGQKVVCSYHPAYLIREGMKDHGTFKADLVRAQEDMMFPELRYPNPTLLPNPQGPDKHGARDRLLDPSQRDEMLTIDIEYLSGKNGKRGKLICVGMTDSRDWGVSFPTDLPIEFEEVEEILTCGRPLNMQNSMFDASILEWHYGWDLQPNLAFDTMLAAHAASPELPKGLDYLESIYTRQPNHKDMIDWGLVKAGIQPFSDVYLYNCKDVWTQHQIMEEQWIWDLNDPRALAVFEFEMALLNPLWEVSKRGVRLDHEHLNEVRAELELDVRALNSLLGATTGRAVNVKSWQNVAWVMHDHLGIKCTRKQPKTKNPKTDDKTLAAYIPKCNKHQREVLMLIREIRQKRDLLSKFVNVGLDDDGRSRGHYNPAGTVTGRLASKKFFPTNRGHQQQNIPRDDRVRKSFIADEGKIFGYADLERAESLVVAHITNDPLMLAHHAPGTDAHRSLAALLFDVKEELVTKDQRYLGKQTRHAGNYMEGPETMKQLINQKAHITKVTVTYGDCDRFIKLYRELHIYLEQWWDEVAAELWKTRELVSLMGRARIFYDHIKANLPEAVAYVPQSTVGDVANCGVLACHGIITDHMRPHLTMPEQEIKELASAMKFDWGWEMLNQVHDAIGYQYDEAYTYEVSSAMRRLMGFRLESPKSREEFIIPVEVAIGPSWGEVEPWELDLVA